MEFLDRATNSKLNRIHERALRLVCKDSESELEKLKKKYGTIHQHKEIRESGMAAHL